MVRMCKIPHQRYLRTAIRPPNLTLDVMMGNRNSDTELWTAAGGNPAGIVEKW